MLRKEFFVVCVLQSVYISTMKMSLSFHASNKTYSDAISDCESVTGSSLAILRTIPHGEIPNQTGEFWIGTRQYLSDFISYQGCLRENDTANATHITTKFATVGYCSHVCMNDGYRCFTHTRNSCTCLHNVSMDFLPTNYDGCKDEKGRKIYFNEDLQTNSTNDRCLMLSCNTQKLQPAKCSSLHKGLCTDNHTTFAKTYTLAHLDCLKIGSDLKAPKKVKCAPNGDSYWVNAQRHEYDAELTQTGERTTHCGYVKLNKAGSQHHSNENCNEKKGYICMHESGDNDESSSNGYTKEHQIVTGNLSEEAKPRSIPLSPSSFGHTEVIKVIIPVSILSAICVVSLITVGIVKRRKRPEMSSGENGGEWQRIRISYSVVTATDGNILKCEQTTVDHTANESSCKSLVQDDSEYDELRKQIHEVKSENIYDHGHTGPDGQCGQSSDLYDRVTKKSSELQMAKKDDGYASHKDVC